MSSIFRISRIFFKKFSKIFRPSGKAGVLGLFLKNSNREEIYIRNGINWLDTFLCIVGFFQIACTNAKVYKMLAFGIIKRNKTKRKKAPVRWKCGKHCWHNLNLAGPIILTYSTFLALLPLRLNAKWQKAAFVERCKQGSIPHIRLFTTLIGHSPNFLHHMWRDYLQELAINL